jgi:hypothetical protein
MDRMRLATCKQQRLPRLLYVPPQWVFKTRQAGGDFLAAPQAGRNWDASGRTRVKERPALRPPCVPPANLGPELKAQTHEAYMRGQPYIMRATGQ